MKQPKESASLYMSVVCVFACKTLPKVSISLSVSCLCSDLWNAAKRVSIPLHVSYLCFQLWNTEKQKQTKISLSLCQLFVLSYIKHCREGQHLSVSCLHFDLWNTLYISVWTVSVHLSNPSKESASLCELLVFFHMKHCIFIYMHAYSYMYTHYLNC